MPFKKSLILVKLNVWSFRIELLAEIILCCFSLLDEVITMRHSINFLKAKQKTLNVYQLKVTETHNLKSLIGIPDIVSRIVNTWY